MAPSMTFKWFAIALFMAVASNVAVSGNLLRRLGRVSPYCYIENGFDYQGNDIKNVPFTAVDKCCDECNKVDACNAWSWSSYSGGTCWLKSSRGKIIVNADVKSSGLFEGFHAVCQATQDVDYQGNDIGNAPSATADGCCDICHNFLGCRAYAWSNQNGGTCWLKSSKGQVISKPGVKAAEAYPTDVTGPICALAYDVDYPGNDIGSAASAAPGGCCALCAKMDKCRTFSWTNQNGGTCYFKNLSGSPIQKSGVVSSVLKANPSCNVENGVDYFDHDIANSPAKDPAMCCGICSDRADCKAYTWSDYNGGTCWLKSAKGTTVANPKTQSGTTA